jgi:hypothetical protein
LVKKHETAQRALEIAPTYPALPSPLLAAPDPFAPAAAAAPVAPAPPPAPAPAPAPGATPAGPIATSDLTGPTPQALLERAASLGPPRMSWESIVSPDPILDAKHEPRVAERRARFQRIVKGTLGACLGVCVLALVVTAFSGGEEPAAAASGALSASVAARAITPVEHLDGPTLGKARRHVFHVASSAPVASKRHARHAKHRR